MSASDSNSPFNDTSYTRERLELETRVLAAALRQSLEIGDTEGSSLAHEQIFLLLKASQEMVIDEPISLPREVFIDRGRQLPDIDWGSAPEAGSGNADQSGAAAQGAHGSQAAQSAEGDFAPPLTASNEMQGAPQVPAEDMAASAVLASEEAGPAEISVGAIEGAAPESVQDAAQRAVEESTPGLVEAVAQSQVEEAAPLAVDAAAEASFVAADQASVETSGQVSVEASDQGSVEASDQGSVEGSVQGSVEASARGSVEASAQGSVEASDQGSVEASDQGSVESSDQGSVEASDQGSVESSDQGSLEASDQGSVEASGQGSIEANDQGFVEVSEQGSVETSGGGSVEASDQGTLAAIAQGDAAPDTPVALEATDQGSVESHADLRQSAPLGEGQLAALASNETVLEASAESASQSLDQSQDLSAAGAGEEPIAAAFAPGGPESASEAAVVPSVEDFAPPSDVQSPVGQEAESAADASAQPQPAVETAPPPVQQLAVAAVVDENGTDYYGQMKVTDLADFASIHQAFWRMLRVLLRAEIGLVGPARLPHLKRIQRLWIAHDILCDPVTRADYDFRRMGVRGGEEDEDGHAAKKGSHGPRTQLRIGELLQCAGLLEQTELDIAADMHKAMPEMMFGTFLVKQGFIEDADLNCVLLGQQLLKSGDITVVQFQTVMIERSATGLDMDQMLLAKGYINQTLLERAYRYQSEDTLVKVPVVVGPGPKTKIAIKPVQAEVAPHTVTAEAAHPVSPALVPGAVAAAEAAVAAMFPETATVASPASSTDLSQTTQAPAAAHAQGVEASTVAAPGSSNQQSGVPAFSLSNVSHVSTSSFNFSNAAPAWKDQLDWSIPESSGEGDAAAGAEAGPSEAATNEADRSQSKWRAPNVASPDQSEFVAEQAPYVVSANIGDALAKSAQAIAQIWAEDPEPADSWARLQSQTPANPEPSAQGGPEPSAQGGPEPSAQGSPEASAQTSPEFLAQESQEFATPVSQEVPRQESPEVPTLPSPEGLAQAGSDPTPAASLRELMAPVLSTNLPVEAAPHAGGENMMQEIAQMVRQAAAEETKKTTGPLETVHEALGEISQEVSREASDSARAEAAAEAAVSPAVEEPAITPGEQSQSGASKSQADQEWADNPFVSHEQDSTPTPTPSKPLSPSSSSSRASARSAPGDDREDSETVTSSQLPSLGELEIQARAHEKQAQAEHKRGTDEWQIMSVPGSALTSLFLDDEPDSPIKDPLQTKEITGNMNAFIDDSESTDDQYKTGPRKPVQGEASAQSKDADPSPPPPEGGSKKLRRRRTRH